jgi:hypothetical protein
MSLPLTLRDHPSVTVLDLHDGNMRYRKSLCGFLKTFFPHFDDALLNGRYMNRTYGALLIVAVTALTEEVVCGAVVEITVGSSRKPSSFVVSDWMLI